MFISINDKNNDNSLITNYFLDYLLGNNFKKLTLFNIHICYLSTYCGKLVKLNISLILKGYRYINYQQLQVENYNYSHLSTVDKIVYNLLTNYPQLNFVEKCGKL